jgi:hypothetical protein
MDSTTRGVYCQTYQACVYTATRRVFAAAMVTANVRKSLVLPQFFECSLDFVQYRAPLSSLVLAE